MKKVHACVEESKRSNVTVSENGRRANFRNPEKHTYRIVQVDDCLVKAGPRADWVVTKVGVGSIIVELKGKDVAHACEQLFASLNHPDCAPWMEGRRGLLIVCSRVPSFDRSIAKAQTEARKRGVRLKAVCGGSDFVLESLLTA